jgi:glycosyltransferase involved in cell wall biosynthesis
MAYMVPVKALSTIHDLMHRYEGQFPEVSGFRLREYHYKETCKTVKGILVDSQTGKNQVIESYRADPAKIYVLPYTAPAYMYEDHQTDVALKYGLPSKFFFYPAQFWQHKNHELIIRAMAAVKNKIPDICFVFSGAPKNHYETLLKLMKELGVSENVVITGYISNEDISSIYKLARALIMPTYFGPTNIPPLEAMTVGCPVAVSDIYGMPEQIGDGGILFDHQSVSALAEVLHELWTNDERCHELSEKGKQRAQQLGRDSFDQKLMEIIEQVVK